MIAEANGIDGDTELPEGLVLNIPARSSTLHNSYQTFRPYDASEAVGDMTPNLPMSAGAEGCGGIGQIIMVVIAVVASVFLGPQMLALMEGVMGAGVAATVSAGALTGAAASTISQGVGIAIGAQDGFSWRGVALGAIGGGVSAGFSGVPGAAPGAGGATLNLANAPILNNVVGRAVLTNAITQGIGVATGLQDSFNWRSVAAAAVGTGIGAAVGQGLRNTAFETAFGRIGVGAAAGFAGGVAAAALRGGRLSIEQVGRDVFGNVIASALVENSGQGSQQTQQLAGAQISAAQVSADGYLEADYWNSPASTAANRYADTFGGQAITTATSLNGFGREQEMARLMQQANSPQYLPGESAYGSKTTPDGIPFVEVAGVASSAANDIRLAQAQLAYQDDPLVYNAGSGTMGWAVQTASGIEMRALPDAVIGQSASGWQGFMEGMRGQTSVMETQTTVKTLGGYVRTGGQILNGMFNPQEIARGMWSAIDSGNPIEMGVAALGFMPMGSIGKAPVAVEKALLQTEKGLANTANTSGKLRYLGNDTWESPLGLRYGPDAQYGNRVQHVLRHSEDQPMRVGEHGVFDAGRRGAVAIVDEAWALAQNGGPNVMVNTVGGKTVYTVDMGRRVGWVGGQGGALLGNPGVNNIQLIVRNGNHMVTSYPVK